MSTVFIVRIKNKMLIFACNYSNNIHYMLYKMIFKEDEIPFEELSEIGITKENFFNLPIDILNRILLGRLSPVMEFKLLVDGESHI